MDKLLWLCWQCSKTGWTCTNLAAKFLEVFQWCHDIICAGPVKHLFYYSTDVIYSLIPQTSVTYPWKLCWNHTSTTLWKPISTSIKAIAQHILPLAQSSNWYWNWPCSLATVFVLQLHWQSFTFQSGTTDPMTESHHKAETAHLSLCSLALPSVTFVWEKGDLCLTVSLSLNLILSCRVNRQTTQRRWGMAAGGYRLEDKGAKDR